MDILYQIRARQDSFSAGEGRIARLMLDDVGFAASASLDDLARRADVSSATLSRFARTVGCRDLRDLRLQLAQASGVGSRFLDPQARPSNRRFMGRLLAISSPPCVSICRHSKRHDSPMPCGCSARHA